MKVRPTHLIMPALIAAAWLAVADSVTPGQLILAAIAAVGGIWMLNALRIAPAMPKRPGAVFRLASHVAIDIVRSNIAVARLALRSRRAGHAGFLHIPLDMRHHTGLTVLACIITATPGTIWLSYDQNSGVLLLHILDLVDEQEWFDTIKNRYERRLMEIFE